MDNDCSTEVYMERFVLYQLMRAYDLYGEEDLFSPERTEINKRIIEEVKGWALSSWSLSRVNIVDYPYGVIASYLKAVEVIMSHACFIVSILKAGDLPDLLQEYVHHNGIMERAKVLFPDSNTDKELHCYTGYLMFRDCFERIARDILPVPPEPALLPLLRKRLEDTINQMNNTLSDLEKLYHLHHQQAMQEEDVINQINKILSDLEKLDQPR